MSEWAADNTKHHPECYWVTRKVKKTKAWYEFMGMKDCPVCKTVLEIA